jgi:Mn2+/Fe2+ NRAMP family transporter
MRWLSVFGPGAVIASLTIGTGELIFSSRAGSLFGYRLLWLFVLVLALKWVLVYSAARHIVLSGAHPFQRWMELPGPRGWFPLVFFLFAAICFPIWVSFHAGTIGTLLSVFLPAAIGPAAYLVWGGIALIALLLLALAGGYGALERVQLAIVAVMLGSVLICLVLLNPDWQALLDGLLVPQAVRYPDWVSRYPDISGRPLWVEAVTYVGVIGGSSYDYLAYSSYLREKGWGNASHLHARANNHPAPVDQRWLRAPLVDCTLSFIAVLLFTVVFVACGATVLGPQQQVPSGSNLLTLQSAFVSTVYPWLRTLYFAGAFLAIAGTLYGTIEVGPTILRELVLAYRPNLDERRLQPLRRLAILWAGLGALGILGVTVAWQIVSGNPPPGLVAILTPANLFTGVLGCGLVCLLNPWMDARFLPRHLRMPLSLIVLNGLAALLFLFLGLKAYWDHGGIRSLLLLVGTLAAGWTSAWALERKFRNSQSQ